METLPGYMAKKRQQNAKEYYPIVSCHLCKKKKTNKKIHMYLLTFNKHTYRKDKPDINEIGYLLGVGTAERKWRNKNRVEWMRGDISKPIFL